MARRSRLFEGHNLSEYTNAIYDNAQKLALHKLSGVTIPFESDPSFKGIIERLFKQPRQNMPSAVLGINIKDNSILTSKELLDKIAELKKTPGKVLDFLYLDGQDFLNGIAQKLGYTDDTEIRKIWKTRKVSLDKIKLAQRGGIGGKTPFDVKSGELTVENNLIVLNGHRYMPKKEHVESWFEKVVKKYGKAQGIVLRYTMPKKIGIAINFSNGASYLYLKVLKGPPSIFLSGSPLSGTAPNDPSYDPDTWRYNESTVDYDKNAIIGFQLKGKENFAIGYANYNIDEDIAQISNILQFDTGHFAFADVVRRKLTLIESYKQTMTRIYKELKAKNPPPHPDRVILLRKMYSVIYEDLRKIRQMVAESKGASSTIFTGQASGTGSRLQREQVLQNVAKAANGTTITFVEEVNGKLTANGYQINSTLKGIIEGYPFGVLFPDVAEINRGIRASLEKTLKALAQAFAYRARSSTPVTTAAMVSIAKLVGTIGLKKARSAIMAKVKKNLAKDTKTTFKIKLPVVKVKIPNASSINVTRNRYSNKKVILSPQAPSISQQSTEESTELNTQFNVLQLNKYITEAVRSVMKKPALENDTGVFANSVTILGYDEKLKIIKAFYEPDPYHLFSINSEKSRAKTSIEQDPIRIINNAVQSMRSRWEPYLGSGVKVERG